MISFHHLFLSSLLRQKGPQAGGDIDDELCVCMCLAMNNACIHRRKLEHAFRPLSRSKQFGAVASNLRPSQEADNDCMDSEMQQGRGLAAISMISCMCARLQTMHALIFARTGMPFDHHQAQDNLGGALQPALDDVKLCVFYPALQHGPCT